MAPTPATCPHCAAVVEPPDLRICLNCGFDLRARPPRTGGREQPRSPDPVRLLWMYNRGALTLLELECRLVQAAATRPPEEIAPLLPGVVLAKLREGTASPPERPDDGI